MQNTRLLVAQGSSRLSLMVHPRESVRAFGLGVQPSLNREHSSLRRVLRPHAWHPAKCDREHSQERERSDSSRSLGAMSPETDSCGRAPFDRRCKQWQQKQHWLRRSDVWSLMPGTRQGWTAVSCLFHRCSEVLGVCEHSASTEWVLCEHLVSALQALGECEVLCVSMRCYV